MKLFNNDIEWTNYTYYDDQSLMRITQAAEGMVSSVCGSRLPPSRLNAITIRYTQAVTSIIMEMDFSEGACINIGIARQSRFFNSNLEHIGAHANEMPVLPAGAAALMLQRMVYGMVLASEDANVINTGFMNTGMKPVSANRYYAFPGLLVEKLSIAEVAAKGLDIGILPKARKGAAREAMIERLEATVNRLTHVIALDEIILKDMENKLAMKKALKEKREKRLDKTQLRLSSLTGNGEDTETKHAEVDDDKK